MFDRVVNFFRNLLGHNKSKGGTQKGLVFKLVLHISTILIFSYILSNIVISVLVPPLIEILKKTELKTNVMVQNLKLTKLNFRTLKKDVEKRNIFNSSGEFPDEVVVEEDSAPKEEFSLEGPCPNSSLKLKLIGTMYLGKKSSLAVVREDGYEYPDVYYVSDYLYGQEEVILAAVFPKMVILNNKGKRECLYASEEAEEIGESGGRFDEDYDESKSKSKKKKVKYVKI